MMKRRTRSTLYRVRTLFFFNDTATTEIYTLSLHDALPISGETIDYGPCAFLDAFDPATVFSSIDTGGRYAYGNQPIVAELNLARVAEALLPLLADDQEHAASLAVSALEWFRPPDNAP